MPLSGYHIDNVQITSYQMGAAVAVLAPEFLADPIGTLRRQGFAVSPMAEPAWRQLATALQALKPAPGQARTQSPCLEIRIPVR
jgi:hypothetical protein